MSNDSNLKQLLNNQTNKFDVEQPNIAHRARFIEKLTLSNKLNKKKKNNSLRYLNIAAAVLICLGIIRIFNSNHNAKFPAKNPITENPLEDINNAKFHLEGVVSLALAKVELERSPITATIIDEALSQIQFLETEQHKLQEQLKTNYDKRIIKALVDNFQYRINLLENVMHQIKITKEINHENHETI